MAQVVSRGTGIFNSSWDKTVGNYNNNSINLKKTSQKNIKIYIYNIYKIHSFIEKANTEGLLSADLCTIRAENKIVN